MFARVGGARCGHHDRLALGSPRTAGALPGGRRGGVVGVSQVPTREHVFLRKPLIVVVPRDGIEPPTRGFSVLCSTD
jgi:hypothetical protein